MRTYSSICAGSEEFRQCFALDPHCFVHWLYVRYRQIDFSLWNEHVVYHAYRDKIGLWILTKGWSLKFPNFVVFGHISITSSPNLKSKVSSEICSFWGFQKWPCFWLLPSRSWDNWGSRHQGSFQFFTFFYNGTPFNMDTCVKVKAQDQCQWILVVWGSHFKD